MRIRDHEALYCQVRPDVEVSEYERVPRAVVLAGIANRTQYVARSAGDVALGVGGFAGRELAHRRPIGTDVEVRDREADLTIGAEHTEFVGERAQADREPLVPQVQQVRPRTEQRLVIAALTHLELCRRE